MNPSQKIEKLIEWGTKPYRLAKLTGVAENTIRDIWNGKTEIKKVKLENAEKLTAYYDMIERNLSESIVILDWIIGKLDSSRQRLSGNQNLYRKVAKQPFKVFEQLHKIVHGAEYVKEIHVYDKQLEMVTERIATLDVDIIDQLSISDFWIYYAHNMRAQLDK